MPHSQLARSNIADLHYVFTLVSAYRRFLYLIDPDYASQNEPEAWHKVRRDTDIAHAIFKRRLSVGGLEWQFIPASDAEQDKMAAEIMTFLFDHIRRFQQARFNLAEAIFRGTSFAYIDGQRQAAAMVDDKPRMWWLPKRLQHVDRFRFRIRRVDDPAEGDDSPIRTIWDFFSVKRQRWEPLLNPQFFVRHAFEQTEDTLGYGRGLLQSIYFWWRAKEIVLSQGLAGVERWAQGFLTVGVDGLRRGSADRPNDQIVTDWLEELNKQRSEHILVHDKEDVVNVKDWPAKGADMVIKFLEYLNRGLDRLILTSSRPTGGNAETGSFSQASVEAEEMEATFQADRLALSETICDSVGTLTWRRNRGLIAAFMEERGLPFPHRPKFQIMQRKMNDPEKSANIITTALQNNMPVVKQQAYEMLGLTPPTGDDLVITPPQQAPPGFGGPPGAPPPGGEAPLGFGLNRYPVMQYSDWQKRSSNGNGHAERFNQPSEGVTVKLVDERQGVMQFEQGGPCKQGETSAKTGCTPKEGDAKTPAGKAEGGKPKEEPKGEAAETKGNFRTERKALRKRTGWIHENMPGAVGQGDEGPLINNWVDKMKDTPGMARAVMDYTRSAYKEINAELRGQAEPTEENQKRIELIDKAIDDFGTLDEPITVYRGIRESGETPITDTLKAAGVGSKVVLDGYQSTSVDPNTAADFAHEMKGKGGKGIVLEILTDRGAPVGSDRLVSENIGLEGEFLLKSGQTYTVVDVIEDVEFGTDRMEELPMGERRPKGTDRYDVVRLVLDPPGEQLSLFSARRYQSEDFDVTGSDRADKFTQPEDAITIVSKGKKASALLYGKGEPCKPGETSAKTGCTPKSGEAKEGPEKKDKPADEGVEEGEEKVERPIQERPRDEELTSRQRSLRNGVREMLAGDVPPGTTPLNEEEIDFLHELAQRDDVMEARSKLLNAVSTKKQFFDKATGQYIPERAEKHKEWAQQLEEGKGKVTDASLPKEGQRPRAIILMGPPGSGKSTVLAKQAGIDESEFVTINPDHAKELIPENAGGVGAGTVHEESCHIITEFSERPALEGGHNIILDQTGATPEKTGPKIDRLTALGYDVEVYRVELDPLESAKRAMKRFEDIGRYVDPEYILGKVDRNPPRSYDIAKNNPNVKAWGAWDNNVPKGTAAREIDRGSR